jgi:2-polyprenyl-3-methyl-5-hydroxy-6-metoxy-1,4-benzoquinol methylase
MEKKEHWEAVFAVKKETEVSWYQEYPQTSVRFVKELNLPLNAKIIDIGGGDSYFIDALLDLGYTNLTLLDISEKAIERIKTRLGTKAEKVHFIVSDVLDFNTTETYDFWHDRASFHFLTESNQIKKYAELVSKAVTSQGTMVIGTFSEKAPKKCSGLDITQYNEDKMKVVFNENFEAISCFTEDHKTPFDTIQNFIFCKFLKK